MLDHGLIHQGHVREIRDVSTCTSQHVGAARRSILRDVTLPWQRPRYSVAGSWRDVTLPLRKTKQTYPLQTCYEHNMLPLLYATCLKLLVSFFFEVCWNIWTHKRREFFYGLSACHISCLYFTCRRGDLLTYAPALVALVFQWL